MTNVTHSSTDIDDGGVSLGVEGGGMSFACRNANRSVNIRPKTTNFYHYAYTIASNEK
jgi:hypothetical protein